MKITKQNQVNHGSSFQMYHFCTVKSMHYNKAMSIGYDLVLPIPVGFTTEVPNPPTSPETAIIGWGWLGW